MKNSIMFDCLKKNRVAVILFLAATVFSGAVFCLYGVMIEPFLYAELLLAATLIILLAADYLSERKAAKRREQLRRDILSGGSFEPAGASLRDHDYADMIRTLTQEIQKLQNDYSQKQRDDDDYYTAWVHQIKTPIATMKLLLSDDTEEHKALSAELFRIEQYVDMVLSYIRLESDSNDLVIRAYELDALIRESLRKFAPQFIRRKLRLVYEPTDQTVVTDKKWFIFMLDQLISNAVKYTPDGEIRITAADHRVSISDTGIGVAPDDLPRIFEKGYTGVNGRIGQQSSGLGLFLTKKAADLLAVRIDIQSAVGEGSTFTLILPDSAD